MASSLFIVLAVAVAGLVRFDLITEVRYQRMKVLSVQAIAGGDMNLRALIVDTGERRQLIRVSDWMIRTRPGERVCVSVRRLLLRRWLRYSVVLPGYCNGLRLLSPPDPAGMSVAPRD